MSTRNSNYSIVLFDDICNFCNFWVKFICHRDQYATFRFASLQSKVGKDILTQSHLNTEKIDSIILIQGEECYSKSTAVLHIFKRLGVIWKTFYIFILLPKPIRDWIYILFAKHRYTLFGKRQSCMIPSKQMKERFLE